MDGTKSVPGGGGGGGGKGNALNHPRILIVCFTFCAVGDARLLRRAVRGTGEIPRMRTGAALQDNDHGEQGLR